LSIYRLLKAAVSNSDYAVMNRWKTVNNELKQPGGAEENHKSLLYQNL
jgi:hypothetical protein